MEFLIPGLILVGIMAWASTRIKRNAAKAFEAEEVETPEYSLSKPDGFLSIVDPPDGLLFSAYSKEFGEGDANRVRRATAQLRRLPGTSVNQAAKQAKAGVSELISEDTGIIGGRKCATIVTKRLLDGIPLESYYKILEGTGGIYQLVVDILPQYHDDFRAKADHMIDSFLLN